MCSLIVCSISLYCYVRIKRVYIVREVWGREEDYTEQLKHLLPALQQQ